MAPDTSKHSNGVIEVTLDRVRKLKWTNNVLCEFEAALGVSLFQSPNPFSVGIRSFREALYQMLRVDDPRLTRERCGEFLDEYDQDGEVTKAIIRAWRVSGGLPADPAPDEEHEPEGETKNA